MKCGQLIEYNMRDVFLEKSDAQYVGEISPKPFFLKEIKIEYISGSSV